jgi:hypothetical protein
MPLSHIPLMSFAKLSCRGFATVFAAWFGFGQKEERLAAPLSASFRPFSGNC